jgi:hypothetical protein
MHRHALIEIVDLEKYSVAVGIEGPEVVFLMRVVSVGMY